MVDGSDSACSRAGARFHAVDAFTGKGAQQKLAGRNLVDAAGAQVEQRILFDLADRRAVSTLHIVRVDFQLRLGVDLGVVGEQQVAVGLLGVSLLRVFVDDDPSVEDAVRLPSRIPL